MAVTPPSLPVPPKPPVVPPVTLQGGGLEKTESAAPSKGQEASPESQARESVARGDGPLSKTTTGNPKEREQSQAAPSGASNQTGSAGSREAESQGSSGSSDTVQTIQPVQPLPLLDAEALLREPQDADAGSKQQGTQAGIQVPGHSDQGMPSSGYSPAYWAFTLVALLVISVGLVQFLRKKRVPGRGKASGRLGNKPKPDMNLTGQTAEEVLRALQAQQTARAKAASPQGSRVKENPAARGAAESYRAQKEKPSEKAAMPQEKKPEVIQRTPKSNQEESHFEVRI